ncbi:MAG: NFACT family protein [Caldilineaceae bacterium]
MEPGPLWRALMAGVAGLSPSAAREVAWRATRDAKASTAGVALPAVVQALQELWTPVRDGADARRVAGRRRDRHRLFALPGPREGHLHAHGVHQHGGGSLLCHVHQRGRSLRRAAPDGGRALDAATRKVTRRLDALAGDAPAPGEVEALRTQAEWLLALSSQVTPGQTELAVPLGDAPDATLRIPLDGKHTPVEQAQRMFQRGQVGARRRVHPPAAGAVAGRPGAA